LLQKRPGFEKIEDCRQFVKKALEGKNMHYQSWTERINRMERSCQ
jgi:hypothetical protein